MKKIVAVLLLGSSTIPSAAAAAATADAPSADATDETSEVQRRDEITVTARRVDENIQDVPISITAISNKSLRNLQITDVSALSRISPSIGVSRSQRGSSTPAIMIRGQRSFSGSALAEPAVTVYFADIGQSIAGGAADSLFDLQSVQVLKGPQGTLFGRNTTGGAILLTPNAPNDRMEGYIQASVGDYDLRDFEGAINIPLTDGLAIRLAGKSTRRDGYLYNPTTNMRAENLNSDSIRATLRAELGDNVTSSFIGTYFNNDAVNGTALLSFDPNYVSPNILGGQTRAFLSNIYAETLQRRADNGFYYYEQSIINESKARAHAIQNITKVDIDTGLDSLYIKNIVGIRHVKTHSIYSADATSSSILPSIADVKANIFSDEVQVAGRSGNLSFLGGLYYYQIKGTDTGYSMQFSALSSLLPSAFPIFNYSDTNFFNRSYAAFAHLDYTIQAFTLSAGFRITRDERRLTYFNRATSVRATNPYRCALTGVVVAQNNRNLCAVVANPVSFTKPTWDISLSWKASDSVNVYGAYRRGYRSGGFNTSPAFNASLPIQDVISGLVFKPETVDDFELGLKTQFDVGSMSGRLNIAAFHDILRDAQRTQNAAVPGTNPPVITSATFNAARGYVTGAEIELELQPTDRLTLSSGMSITKTGYSKFIDFINNPTNIGGLGTLVPVDISDSTFMLVPKYQLNATARYEIPIRNDESLAVQMNYSYQSSASLSEVSSRNCGPAGLPYTGCGNRQGRLPAFGVANLRAEWNNMLKSSVTLAAFVNNVFDKQYYFSGTAAVNALGFVNDAPAAPRMFGVELRVPFGEN